MRQFTYHALKSSPPAIPSRIIHVEPATCSTIALFCVEYSIVACSRRKVFALLSFNTAFDGGGGSGQRQWTETGLHMVVRYNYDFLLI
jgi:hypothetical protein